MTINRQSILKAFYQFDQKKLPIINVKGSFTSAMDIKLRKELCEEWLTTFDGIDTETWDKVIALALKECKTYPSYDKMFELIERVSTAEESWPEPEPAAPVPEPKPARSCSQKQKLAKMFEMARSGNFSEARNYCSANVTAAELNEYAAQHWPDAAERILKDCVSELTEIIMQEHTCTECKGIKRCRTYGYRTIGYIDKYSGCLCTRMVECRERRKERQEQGC